MGAIRPYDKELQMFCEPPREPDMAKLRFLRWLAEQGKLEHEAFGDAAGSLVYIRSERGSRKGPA